MTHSPTNPTNVPTVLLRTRRRWAVWLATGFGVGYLPVMPGTYGSALGVAIYASLIPLVASTPYPFPILCLGSLILTAASIWVVALALPSFSSDDPQNIVLDEVAGQVLTLLALPLVPNWTLSYWMAVAAGFVLFRILDAVKPYPIWKLGHWRGAWGVVADDLGAGLVGAAMLAGSTYWFGWP
ncbi:MAG: phosphatidylglycerophosphatase A [Acidobacteria bacterium]|nr:phosphatidylglycerophosphatase A [Acidobacteriota bacterium]